MLDWNRLGIGRGLMEPLAQSSSVASDEHHVKRLVSRCPGRDSTWAPSEYKCSLADAY